MMRNFIKLFCLLIFSSSFSWGGLRYLIRTTPAQTSFEVPPHVWSYPSDDESMRVSIGFSFPFGGHEYTRVYINTNGTLSFTSNSNNWANTQLSGSAAEFEIYPYWDDMYPPGGGSIKYGTIGSGVNKHFVVSWENLPHYSNSNDHGNFTFQAVLYQDGRIRFRYDPNSDADGASKPYDNNHNGATIGVKEDDSHYDQYSYDAVIDQTKDVLYSPVPPPTDNDYSEFRFDELEYTGAAGEVRDSHWHQHGTGHNVPLVPGKICNGADLRADGTSDYIKIGEGALDGVKNFTILVWTKGTSSRSRELLSSANNNRDNEAGFWYDSINRFDPDYHETSVGALSSPTINDGHWHHLVWRVKRRRSCYFVDGHKVGCKNLARNYRLSVQSLIVGQEQDNVGGGFDGNQDWEGIIDELLIFRKALSDNKIHSIYTNQNNGKNWDGSGPRTCPYPTVTKISCVLRDPVNHTTNPKRIPGARIRYALEVRNPNTSTIHNAKVQDVLPSNLDSNSIGAVHVESGNCNCASTASSGGTGTSPLTINFGDIPGGTTKCGYFEVNIK